MGYHRYRDGLSQVQGRTVTGTGTDCHRYRHGLSQVQGLTITGIKIHLHAEHACTDSLPDTLRISLFFYRGYEEIGKAGSYSAVLTERRVVTELLQMGVP